MAWLNGSVATAGEIAEVLANNYGHFTTLQVRGAAAQGLDLHLQRLDEASVELFGQSLSRDRSIELFGAALRDSGLDDCTLRATVVSRDFDITYPDKPCSLDVLVRIAPAAVPAEHALRLKAFSYMRYLPQLKHVGIFPLYHHRRLAVLAGYDDALFLDRVGVISEGTLWNIGFWRGDDVIWPDAPALRGTCERLLKCGLAELGIVQSTRQVTSTDLAAFDGAFISNSRGVQPVAAIDAVVYPLVPGRMDQLRQALASQPWQEI